MYALSVEICESPCSNTPLFKTSRKVSLWDQFPVAELPLGAAAEHVGRTAKPESWQEDHKWLSPELWTSGEIGELWCFGYKRLLIREYFDM